MVTVAQLVESRIVIPVVAGSSPVGHPKYSGLSLEVVKIARVAELVDALASGVSAFGCGGSSPPLRTTTSKVVIAS